jgi:hypothetical protein
MADSGLLDQLCYVRMVIARLWEGYQKAYSEFDERLGVWTRKLDGWRESITKTQENELESPMPWLHPFKLAAEELKPLEEELATAVKQGETGQRDLSRLHEVLERHQLRLPLTAPDMNPRFQPWGMKEQ